MSTTITFTLPVPDAIKVMEFVHNLNTSPESILEPTDNDLSSEDALPSEPLKDQEDVNSEPPLKVTKMPGFGRTTESIKETEQAKRERIAKQQAKTQKRIDKELEQAKLDAKNKEELAAIQKANQVSSKPLPKKPWDN